MGHGATVLQHRVRGTEGRAPPASSYLICPRVRGQGAVPPHSTDESRREGKVCKLCGRPSWTGQGPYSRARKPSKKFFLLHRECQDSCAGHQDMAEQ